MIDERESHARRLDGYQRKNDDMVLFEALLTIVLRR